MNRKKWHHCPLLGERETVIWTGKDEGGGRGVSLDGFLEEEEADVQRGLRGGVPEGVVLGEQSRRKKKCRACRFKRAGETSRGLWGGRWTHSNREHV